MSEGERRLVLSAEIKLWKGTCSHYIVDVHKDMISLLVLPCGIEVMYRCSMFSLTSKLLFFLKLLTERIVRETFPLIVLHNLILPYKSITGHVNFSKLPREFNIVTLLEIFTSNNKLLLQILQKNNSQKNNRVHYCTKKSYTIVQRNQAQSTIHTHWW